MRATLVFFGLPGRIYAVDKGREHYSGDAPQQ
jgi:hypothetical protein